MFKINQNERLSVKSFNLCKGGVLTWLSQVSALVCEQFSYIRKIILSKTGVAGMTFYTSVG